MDISTNPEEDILLLTNCPDQLLVIDVPLVNDVPDSPEVVATSEIHGVPHCSEELKPFVGMKFENLEQGLDFYKAYAKACGFIPRLDSRVDNHKKCVTFAAGLIMRENEESFTWLFDNFMKAMGNTTHRLLSMWHIMKKLPDKVGSTIYKDTDFLKEISSIVWNEDIEPTEFESKWCSIMEKHDLSGNEWLKIHKRNVFEFYTPPVFYDFQEELKGACYSCNEANKSTKERDVERLFVMDRESKKVYEVDVDGKTLVCSCKRFQRFGILCRHCVWVLHNKGFDEIPSEYLLPRWSNYATFRPIFNVVGTSLEGDCASIDTRQNTISELWSGVFTAVSLVEDDEEKEKELLELLQSFNEKLLISSSGGKSKSKKTQIETLLGSKIPTKAHILPPNQAKNKGSGRRMTSEKEKAMEEHAKPLRKCRACGEMARHDSRNCPSQLPNK
ncbi:protein FAR1-RELATED SEQUENCE 2-like [Silene latifolia]|uniref:protein FAR1-RELATED SEQUENCE 2-like n=1 Tax=Silene latifolia TaxID=37657 RepID=UPI003D7740C1